MELQFTKFFDVESPVGIEQNVKEMNGEFHSIGVDLYMPKLTQKFIDAILLVNQDYEIKKYVENSFLEIFDKSKHRLLMSFSKDVYTIYQNMQIPTGVGILIPKDYFITVNPKSSCFKMEYTVIEGFIDENYTFGMGVQLNLLESSISLKADQKFAQLVLRKAEFIKKLNEVPLKDWGELPDVIKRREVRTGGFGTTGQFK